MSWVSLQPDEGGGKHNGIGDVAPVRSVVHGQESWSHQQVTFPFFGMHYASSLGLMVPCALQGTPTAWGATEFHIFKAKNQHFDLSQNKPEQRLKLDFFQGAFSRDECLN